MLLLTEIQLQQIADVVRDRISSFIYNYIDKEMVDPETLSRLRKKGLIAKEIVSLPEDAYRVGMLLEILGVDKMGIMSVAQLKEFLKTRPFPIEPVASVSLLYAKTTAGEYVTGLGDLFVREIREYVHAEDYRITTDRIRSRKSAAQKAKSLEELREVIFEGLDKKQQIKEIIGTLGRTLPAGFDVDVTRIARTEIHNAMQQGQADYIEKTSADPHVFKLPLLMACADCRRLYLHEDGSPIIFKLSELRDHSNVGLSRRGWKATLEAIHPSCRCIVGKVPNKDWVPLPDGRIVKKGEAPAGQLNLKDW
jgi:hypothetical protein